MAIVNFILQGKGGVGKSTLAGYLTQFYLSNGITPICFDTDPNNGTFSAVPAYKAKRVKLGDTTDEINPRYFDGLIEDILATGEDDVVIVDNGASTFLPLCAYLAENNVFNIIKDAGHTLRLNTVIVGGYMFDDTIDGLANIIDHFPNVPLVIWENTFFGKVEKGGRNFEQSGLYHECKASIYGIVKIPLSRRETFGADIEDCLKEHLTFQEAIQSQKFKFMSKQRLKQSQDAIFQSIELAGLGV